MVTKKRAELPSDRAARKIKDQQELVERKRTAEDRLRRDMAMTFRSDHGLRVLQWLHDECGFGQPIVGADYRGDIDEKRSTYGAMRLNLYIKIRKLLPFNILKEVEFHEHK